MDDDSLHSVSNSRPAAKEASRKTGLEDQAAGTVGTELAQDNDSSDNTTALLKPLSFFRGMLMFFQGNIWL